MKQQLNLKKIFYGLGAVALLFGLWGFYTRLFIGEKTVNYGSYVTQVATKGS